jgi:anion transporter
MNKRNLGIILSFLIGGALWFAPLPQGLSPEGQKTLAVTVFCVIWWIFGVTHPAYTTMLLFLGYILFGLAQPAIVFRLASLPLFWLVIGAFLLATAVTKSGLARRVAYFFMIRFANSYLSIVVLAYILGFVLSLMIPQPFPRTLLIMALVGQIIKQSGANAKDAASLGLAVFTSATATTMILLTGDAMLNVAAVALTGIRVGWLEWFSYMAVPGLAASVLMLGLHLLLFRQTGPLNIDKQVLIEEQAELGPLTRQEKATICWVGLALLLWATDFLHHVDPAWVALGVVVGLSLPYVGEVLKPEDINTGVAWPIVIFIIGALAIGTVSKDTGLSQWLTRVALPETPPESAYGFAAMAALVTMGIHMILGSALACMSIVSPPLVDYAVEAGWSPIFPALIVYTSVQIHYLLPFHHVTILLGEGRQAGGYSNMDVLKYGVPLTLVALMVIILVEVPWWKLLGLI